MGSELDASLCIGNSAVQSCRIQDEYQLQYKIIKYRFLSIYNYGYFNAYLGMLFTERYLLLYVNIGNVLDCVERKEAVPYFVFDGWFTMQYYKKGWK